MVKVSHFVKNPEIREFDINSINLKIEITKDIFPPSMHGVFFAKNIKINPGESVIDVGTGSGFLSILASRMGGTVFATDICMEAIILAKKNAILNNSDIVFSHGEYFSNFNECFDVIIANLPQEIVHPSYNISIGSNLSKSIDGGKYGNEYILEFLDIAKHFMNNDSRLYMSIDTVTYYQKTLDKMINNYHTRLIACGSSPTKEYVAENISWYKKLNDAGKITIFLKNNIWMGNEYLFELTLI